MITALFSVSQSLVKTLYANIALIAHLIQSPTTSITGAFTQEEQSVD